MRYKILFIVIFSMLLLFINYHFKDSYLKGSLNEIRSENIEEFNGVQQDIHFFAETVTKLLIDDRVKESLKIDDEKTKREKLFALFKDKYKILQNRSVIVFSLVDLNGKVLFSLNNKNSLEDEGLVKNRSLFGFAVSKYNISFLNIFPIIENNRLLGVLKIGFCESIFSRFWNKEYFILFNKEFLENSCLKNYQKYDDNLFIEKKFVTEFNSYKLFKSLNNKLYEDKNGVVFEKDDNYYVVVKLHIYDILNRNIGKIFIIDENNNLKSIFSEYRIFNYIILFFMSISIFILLLLDRLEKEKEKSFRDPLTKALNRRGGNFYINKHIKNDEVGSLLMIDIDFFKKINDTYGHDVGDLVLKEVSKIIVENIRTTDIFVRFGGEEFLIYLPNANLKSAKSIAQHIRKSVYNYEFDTVGHITISVGVSTKTLKDTFETLQKRADEALYRSKELGRNRVQSK